MVQDTLWIGIVTIAAVLSVSAPVDGEDAVSFRRDVAPIFMNHCLACHGPKQTEGGYRVDTFERAMQAGDSGIVGNTDGDLNASEVYRRLISDAADERMPAQQDPLSAEQIAIFKRWIEEGAKFDGDDPQAELAEIIPPPQHPSAPETYPYRMPISALVFSHDGKSLIVGGYHELTVWNPQNGELMRRIPNVGQRTYALALSPDGKTLAVACGEPGRLGEVRLFDPENGDLRKVLGAASDIVLDVAFNPQGDRLALAMPDGAIRVFDVATGKAQLTIASHADWTTAVAWNNEGLMLASASRDKTAKVHDAQSGELLASYAGHAESVTGVAFHPDGKEVFSSGADNKIHRWQIADAVKTGESSFSGEVFKLSTVGEFLFAASADKTVRQFGVRAHNQIASLTGHKDWALSHAYHPSSKRLASGGFDGEVCIWTIEDGKSTVTFVAAPRDKTSQNLTTGQSAK